MSEHDVLLGMGRECAEHAREIAFLRSRLSAVEKERDEARAAEVDAQVAANDALTAKRVAEAALDGVAAGIRGWRCYHCNRFFALSSEAHRHFEGGPACLKAHCESLAKAAQMHMDAFAHDKTGYMSGQAINATRRALAAYRKDFPE